MQDLETLLKFLVKSPLNFVIVGGFAAVLHGCNQTTRDIDICLILSQEHIHLLRQILKPLNPKHRMTPNKLSFIEYPEELEGIHNLYLETDLGILDIISNVDAVGDFNAVFKNAKEISIYGESCHLIAIDDLIKSKKSLGRQKDLVVVDELEAIQSDSDS